MVTLQASDGWHQKSQLTLVADGKLYLVQQGDDDWMDVEGGFFMTAQFGATVPTSATIQSVKVHVEHHEIEGIAPNSVEWRIGGGTLSSPNVLGSTSPTLLIGEQNEATVEWDVTTWINSATKANDLKFVVNNRDPNAVKAMIDHVYVEVTYIGE